MEGVIHDISSRVIGIAAVKLVLHIRDRREGKTASAILGLSAPISPRIVGPAKPGASAAGSRHRQQAIQRIISVAAIKCLRASCTCRYERCEVAIVGTAQVEAVGEILHVAGGYGVIAIGEGRVA